MSMASVNLTTSLGSALWSASKKPRSALRSFARRWGYDIVRYKKAKPYPLDVDAFEESLVQSVRPFTVTSVERIVVLSRAVKHLVHQNIPGVFVECGVWRGGSMMVVSKTLLECGVNDRDLYLFDTFEGMPRPVSADESITGQTAEEGFKQHRVGPETSTWARAPLDDVRANMLSTGYPEGRIHCVRGKVEDTLPAGAPDRIALLRLDTDWYESTLHELEHLWPRLSSGGIAIFDDYGHWRGCQRAVDEYFRQHQLSLFLNRVDYSARLVTKP